MLRETLRLPLKWVSIEGLFLNSVSHVICSLLWLPVFRSQRFFRFHSQAWIAEFSLRAAIAGHSVSSFGKSSGKPWHNPPTFANCPHLLIYQTHLTNKLLSSTHQLRRASIRQYSHPGNSRSCTRRCQIGSTRRVSLTRLPKSL